MDQYHSDNVEWERLRIQIYHVYQGIIPPAGHGVSDQSPDIFVGWLLLQGHAKLRWADGERVEACAGQWLFPKAGKRYQSFSRDAQLLSLRFRASWPDGRCFLDNKKSVLLEDEEHPDLKRCGLGLERVIRQNALPRKRFFIEPL